MYPADARIAIMLLCFYAAHTDFSSRVFQGAQPKKMMMSDFDYFKVFIKLKALES